MFSRFQALRAGFTARQIDYRLSTGRWELVLPNVYRIAGTPSSLRQRLMAAALWGDEAAVVSHRSAAVLWHLDAVRMEQPEITAPRRLRSSSVIAHFTADLPVADRAERYGIPVTSPSRTLVDIAPFVSDEVLETALEDALRRRLTTIARLEWRVEQLGTRAGTRAIRGLLDERQNRPFESRLEVRFDLCKR